MIREIIGTELLRLLSHRMARQANAVELMPKYRLRKSIRLTEEEKNEIDKIWRPISSNIDYRYWEVYKGAFKFSPMLMPDDIYVRKILRVLNPMRKCYCLQNKNMYPILYPGLRKPVTLINCMDGIAVDATNQFVSESHIIGILKRATQSIGGGGNLLIVKPSSDSCSGNGVAILDLQNEAHCTELISKAGANYVIQQLLAQSDNTRRFNPSSLNTFRINTLNLNGKITVENIMFRHGRGDSVVDNAGAGGVCIGFDPDGKAVGKAIDASLNVYETTPFGAKYSELDIPELQNISDMATWAHKTYLPMMGHAAWDFALDENDEPVFIEVNLGWPGIMTEQLSSCRPIFGERTPEVIDYAISNQQKMSFTDFIGHWT